MLQCEVIGNLGADATIKEFKGQKFMAFNVAHTESYNDQQGQKHERTIWVSCLKFGESAVINYLKKGTRVFVRGELYTKIYTANGTTQVGINCKVRELQLLGGSNKADQQAEQPTVQGQGATYSAPEQSNPFPANDGNDDLPF